MDSHIDTKILDFIESYFNKYITENFAIWDYYILNCSPYTSIIAECGFLSNPQDEALLITDKYQEEIAYAIFKGVVTYLVDATFNC
jgi:N-acetylmuramoyl-L-alanine amidase